MAFDISHFGLSSETLPAGWREDRLDAIADFNPEQVDMNYPHAFIEYLDISNVSKGMIGKPELLALENAPSRAKRIVLENDTIISTVRPGNRAYTFLKKIPPNLIVSTGFAVLRARYSTPRYLYYIATSDPVIDYLASVAEEKTAYPSVNPSDIAECVVPIPPLPEQRAIAHILGTLDDKIELNRRMNETLEVMARALFKAWFVDFDPVRAKAEGRHPGLSKPIADLFPDHFEDSELGRIPKGWEVLSLDQIARFLNGLALQKYPAKDGRSLPVVKIAQLRAGNTDGADLATADLESDYIVEDGDVLFSWSGSLECVLWAGGRGALNQHLFKVTSTEFPKWFYYLWIQQHLEAFRHIAAGKATTMGHIQRHHLSDAKVLAPPPRLLQVLNKMLDPIVVGVWRSRVQSRTLAAIRDALLPKLLSGEIRIKDAEKFVEARS